MGRTLKISMVFFSKFKNLTINTNTLIKHNSINNLQNIAIYLQYLRLSQLLELIFICILLKLVEQSVQSV